MENITTPNLKTWQTLTVIAVIGLLAGGLIYFLTDSSGQSYCKSLEKDIIEQQNFTGNIACRTPGSANFNISEEVKNNTELECVCKLVQDGNVRILPITRSR